MGVTPPGGTSTEWECAAGTRSLVKTLFRRRGSLKIERAHMSFLLLRNTACSGCATQRNSADQVSPRVMQTRE